MADLFERFLAVLVAEQELRPKRQDWVPDGMEGHDSPQWVLAERAAMLNAVNEFRQQAGKSPVTAEEIFKCERQAAGHCDYTRKLALYCSELAQGIKNPHG